MTPLYLLDLIAEATEKWLDNAVWETKTEIEWVFWLGYSLWDDWKVYYEFNPEYHKPNKVVVWFEENVISDKETFKSLWWWYAKDKNYVFHKWLVLKWITSEWFEYLTTSDHSLYDGYWVFWDWINAKVIVNWEILEGVNLWEFWYSEKLMCWTDWNIAVRRNFVVNKVS